ncbi:hypothetical protein VNO80_07614 [Phaseolus coccineus]|uniref:Uncharacterized protein n=1 Tax=Phaseolus coccineus TaxID=3886 RepID=A0AAN9NK02_PHACN
MTWSTLVYSMKTGPALAIGKSEFGSSYYRNSEVPISQHILYSISESISEARNLVLLYLYTKQKLSRWSTHHLRKGRCMKQGPGPPVLKRRLLASPFEGEGSVGSEGIVGERGFYRGESRKELGVTSEGEHEAIVKELENMESRDRTLWLGTRNQQVEWVHKEALNGGGGILSMWHKLGFKCDSQEVGDGAANQRALMQPNHSGASSAIVKDQFWCSVVYGIEDLVWCEGGIAIAFSCQGLWKDGIEVQHFSFPKKAMVLHSVDSKEGKRKICRVCGGREMMVGKNSRDAADCHSRSTFWYVKYRGYGAIGGMLGKQNAAAVAGQIK